MQVTAIFVEGPHGYEAFVEEIPGALVSAATLDEARDKFCAAVRAVLNLHRELAECSLSLAHVSFRREPLEVG
jgi:hypothetical protein